MSQTKAKKTTKNQGVSLLEVVIATAVISISFLAFINVYTYVSKSISISKARTLAYNYAQEKIEKLKSLNYYNVIPTATVSYDNAFSPAVPYDTEFFPPETISSGGLTFVRYTHVENAQESSAGDIVAVSAYTDTGMKQITVTVKWTENMKEKKVMLKNVLSNFSMEAINSAFIGQVVDATSLVPIEGASVVVAENMGWQDATDVNGNYRVKAMPGSYSLVVTADGYFPADRLVSISGGQVAVQNFDLTRMARGVIKGHAWLNDHVVISQVVASTTTIDGIEQEYTELYNPTTYYVLVSNGWPPKIEFCYQHHSQAAAFAIPMTYKVTNSSIPPKGYYLIANTNTITACGTTRIADAVYTAPLFNVILEPDAGAVGIRWQATSQWIDKVGWNRSGLGQTAPMYETQALIQAAGFTEEEQYVRRTSTYPSVQSGFGRAYDSGNNNVDFIDMVTMSYPPKNTTDSEPLISGTPAIGAVISSNDGLSGPTTAYVRGIKGSTTSPPWAEFRLVNVATGTWTVALASYTAPTCHFIQVSTVVITANTTTYIPNDITVPAWPSANVNSTALYNLTDQGFISGKVTNVAGQGINPMVVINASYPTAANGFFFIQVGTGTQSIAANPGNYNANYVSQTKEVQVFQGQITSDVNFILSQGGMLRGTVTIDGTNPLPGIAIKASDDNGVVHAQDVTDSNGSFTLVNLSTGDYTVEPIIGSKETSTPESYTPTVSIGSNIFVGTFTVTGTMGTITGSVKENGESISTGVLIVATDNTIATDPPTLSTATLTSSAYYATTSLENGTYAVEVRGSTSTVYNVYGWYPKLGSSAPTYSRQSQTNVSVTSGQTETGVDLSW